MLTEILVILALIVLNGVLAMSELAIVSARPARLKPLEGKSRGARMALRLLARLPLYGFAFAPLGSMAQTTRV